MSEKTWLKVISQAWGLWLPPPAFLPAAAPLSSKHTAISIISGSAVLEVSLFRPWCKRGAISAALSVVFLSIQGSYMFQYHGKIKALIQTITFPAQWKTSLIHSHHSREFWSMYHSCGYLWDDIFNCRHFWRDQERVVLLPDMGQFNKGKIISSYFTSRDPCSQHGQILLLPGPEKVNISKHFSCGYQALLSCILYSVQGKWLLKGTFWFKQQCWLWRW